MVVGTVGRVGRASIYRGEAHRAAKALHELPQYRVMPYLRAIQG